MKSPAGASRWMGRLAVLVAVLYILDRGLKLAAVVHFFRRPAPAPPAAWPRITLLQPLTRGASNLPEALRCRAQQEYPGPVQHLLLCDAQDSATQRLCAQWQRDNPQLDVQIVPVVSPHGAVATKVIKLKAGLALAAGEVLCFVDDDVNLRSQALRELVTWLDGRDAGAVFGLACYTDWSNTWSSLMSAFVNGNALLSYIPLTYVADPFTITGHVFALRREVFAACGGLDGMGEARIDDDHELARRVRGLGLRCVQTPLIYDVENRLASFDVYANQMRRWFVIPRQAMAPFLTPREQAVTVLGSVGNLLLPLLALLAVLTRAAWTPATLAGVALGSVYLFCERRYLGRRTPLRRWPLVFIAALAAPIQAVLALAGPSRFEWRGQQMELRRGGDAEVNR